VTLRLREAQNIIDSLAAAEAKPEMKIDVFGTISSDDEFFFHNIQLKSLLSAIVQVGLFDRYAKSQKRTDFMVGNSNGDSAMLVCGGRQSFRDLIVNSSALNAVRTFEKTPERPVERALGSDKVMSLVAAHAAPLNLPISMPLLSGLSLTEYNALETKVSEQGQNQYQPVDGSSMELRKLVQSLFEEKGVERFINIGPASALRGSDYRMVGSGEIESCDSIELDPMLGWFWRGIRPAAVALAQ
jgi:hypothetical protein